MSLCGWTYEKRDKGKSTDEVTGQQRPDSALGNQETCFLNYTNMRVEMQNRYSEQYLSYWAKKADHIKISILARH